MVVCRGGGRRRAHGGGDLAPVAAAAAPAARSARGHRAGDGGPLAAIVIGQPLGFALAYYGGSLAWVLAGELLFGLASGLAYYAALYYAMALQRGAVEAGGGHEGLIGLGFAAGPGLALLGGALGWGAAGAVPALAVLVVACAAGRATSCGYQAPFYFHNQLR